VVGGGGVVGRERTLPGERNCGCDLDHVAARRGRLHLFGRERTTGQEIDMIQPTNGIRDLTADEIHLVSGGQTWAYEIRSADGVLDVGLRLDKTTGREVPYAIWTAAAQ
jgi:hypothetical protein